MASLLASGDWRTRVFKLCPGLCVSFMEVAKMMAEEGLLAIRYSLFSLSVLPERVLCVLGGVSQCFGKERQDRK